MVTIKRTENDNCQQGGREVGTTWAVLVGMKNSAATMENDMGGSSKIKTIIIRSSSNLTSGHRSKEFKEDLEDVATPTFIAVFHSKPGN